MRDSARQSDRNRHGTSIVALTPWQIAELMRPCAARAQDTHAKFSGIDGGRNRIVGGGTFGIAAELHRLLADFAEAGEFVILDPNLS